MNRKAKYSFSQQRWDQWEGMVKRLVDNKIRVLAYTLPVHPATGNRKVKDKNGTTEEGYMDQVRRMKEMEQKYPGYFFFYDYNNGGNNGLSDEDFVNVDHCNYTGAVKCTTAVNQYLQEIIRKHNIPTRKVTP
jgi:hypothetical protein